MGEVAESEYRAALKRIMANLQRISPEEQDRREAEQAAFMERQLAFAQARERQRVQREREAAERFRKEKEEAARKAARDKGEPMWWCYVDLGPRWSRQWLYEHVAYEVPEVMHASVPEELTCSALREGLEALRYARRQKKAIEHPVAYLVAAASAYQEKKPKVLRPQHEALKRPELICPHRL